MTLQHVSQILNNATAPQNPNPHSLPFPVNASTGKEYQNSNQENLLLTTRANNYTSNLWATLKQWNALNESVAKGQKGTVITYYKEEQAQDGTVNKVLKKSVVFNRCQLSVLTPSEQSN